MVRRFMPIRSRLSKMSKKLASFHQALPFLSAIALLLPLLWSSGSGPLPQVYSGDEVHYLLAINSLLYDGDLDLANNYASTYKGSFQAGKNFAGIALDHQTVWFDQGVRVNWEKLYETDPLKFDRSADGYPVPRLIEGQSDPGPHPEYSIHPPGLALLLATLLYPLRDTSLVEPAAVTCSTLAIILAFFLFRSLLQNYADLATVNLTAVVAFLGTPAWAYGRTLFSEPYLLLFAVGAYWASLRKRNPLLSGVFIGFGILMKPPFALLLAPILVRYLWEHDVKSITKVTLPVIVGILTILAINDSMFGSPWRASQEWQAGSLIRGVGGMIFSLKYGALMIAPASVVAAIAWPKFIAMHPKDGLTIIAAFVLYLIMAASWKFWNGATAYAARLIVPVVPLLFVSLVALPMMGLWRFRAFRFVSITICVISIVIGGFASMPYWINWDTNPPLRLAQYLLR
jgi:hypothetical protein